MLILSSTKLGGADLHAHWLREMLLGIRDL